MVKTIGEIKRMSHKNGVVVMRERRVTITQVITSKLTHKDENKL